MEKLNVYFNNQIVGYLARYENKYAFEYDSDCLWMAFLYLLFSLPVKRGVFIPNEMIFNGFFGVFADSMPDS